MRYENTFSRGLRLKLPTGGQRLIGACEHRDDPKVIIEGTVLKRYDSARRSEPDEVEELPPGTEVRAWDEDAGHPLLGII